jgi:hypothetical protein
MQRMFQVVADDLDSEIISPARIEFDADAVGVPVMRAAPQLFLKTAGVCATLGFQF